MPLPGCIAPGDKAAPEKPAATAGKSTGEIAPEAPTEKEQSRLAAVEEFLARTQQYRSPVSSAALQPPVAPGSTVADANEKAEVPAAQPKPPVAVEKDEAVANTQVVLATESAAGKPGPAIPAVQAVTIRGSQPRLAAPAEPVRTNATNAPLEAQPPTANTSLDRLLPHLQTRVDAEKDFDAEWQLRLVQLALDRDEDAIKISTNVPPTSRELFRAVIQAAAAARNVIRNPMLSGEDALRQAEELRRVLADRADLVVLTVALCRKVLTFGSYEEMPKEEFVSGRTIQTIVYSEIANLRGVQNSEGLYETRLLTRLEVLTGDGKSVWQREEPEIVDLCRRPRTDFFVAQRITLPPMLPAGDYVLKVLVEDKVSGRASEVSHRFALVSPVSIAKSRP